MICPVCDRTNAKICGRCYRCKDGDDPCCSCKEQESGVRSQESEETVPNSESQTPNPGPRADVITLCGALVWAYDPKKLIQEPPAPKGIVLIEHLNRERRWITRCDAWCHESTGGPCACLCGGKFHGITEKSERWNNLIVDVGPSLVARYKNIGVDVSGLEIEIEKQNSGARIQEPVGGDV